MRARLFGTIVGILAMAAPAFGFDLQGHRGARGLYPENTLPAFAAALSIGVTTLEFDTGVTADGKVIVAHDRRLNPLITRDASGQWLEGKEGPTVKSLTLAELGRFDVGAIRPDTPYAKTFAQQRAVPATKMPSVADVAALAQKAGNKLVRFNIETKLSPVFPEETVSPEEFASALVAAVRAAGIATRADIQSFDWRTLGVVQKIAPEMTTVYLSSENSTVWRDKAEPSPWFAGLKLVDHGGSLPRMVKAAGGKIWSPFFRDLTPEALAEARALQVKVVVWTVNERADIDRMIAMGVDGIITDYPDAAREVMAKRGMKLPTPTPVQP
jgi:glycerophosphoryl diester phosphodiesterase